MVGHQHIGMQAATGFVNRAPEEFEIGDVIAGVEKANAAVVATLYNVLWNSRNINSQTAGQELSSGVKAVHPL